MKITTCLLLIFSILAAKAQVVTNVSKLPFTQTITNHDEFLEQFYDLSAPTGYRSRRVPASNVLAYINANLAGNGANLTNLVFSSIVIAGTNTTVVTNTSASTGQTSYTVSATTDTNVIIKLTLPTYGAVVQSDLTVDVVTTNMVNISDLSVTLPAGIYECQLMFCNTNWSNPGPSEDAIAYNLAGGSATISETLLAGEGLQMVSNGRIGMAAILTASQVFPDNIAAFGDQVSCVVKGTIHVTVGGTVIPKVRCAQGGSISTVLKVLHGSYVVYTKIQ